MIQKNTQALKMMLFIIQIKLYTVYKFNAKNKHSLL